MGAAKRENALPRITVLPSLVISSAARNLCYSRSGKRCEDSGEQETPCFTQGTSSPIPFPCLQERSRAPHGMTKREAGYLTWLFIRPRRRLPLRGSLSSAFGAPLLQGATPLACKNATPKHHSLPDGKVNEMRVPLPPHQKPSLRGEGAPKGRIGYWRYESEGGKRLKQAENESTAFPVSSFRAKREIFLAHRSSDEREMRSST